MNTISDLLEELGFLQTFDVLSKSNLSDFFTSQNRWGIYVLHFQDGSCYVGQSIDVDQRFRTHRRDWTVPILSVSFKSVNAYDLTLEENITIENFKKLRKSLPKGQQFRIRNIKVNEYQRGEADFDFIMPPEKQDVWINDLAKIDIYGERSQFADLRAQYADKFKHKFMRKPFAQDVLEVMHAYAQATIPAMLQTEAVFWAASFLPSTHIYSRINIFWQEVFTAWANNDLRFSFHTAFDPTGLPDGIMKLFYAFDYVQITAENLSTITDQRDKEAEEIFEEIGFTLQDRNNLISDLRVVFTKFPTLLISNDFYKPGGDDQIHFEVVGKQDALTLIHDPDFCQSMRTMNLRLMRLGPSRWAANHCMDLADHLIT
jgi:hypothetical protein